MKSAPKSYPELVRKLREIKNLGWVENTRPSNIHGSIGNTLEDLLGKKENNLSLPDFLDFEIKARRSNTSSVVSLFSKATARRGNRKLFNKYNRIDSNDGISRLYCSLYMNTPSLIHGKYLFSLSFDDFANPQFINVEVEDTATGEKLKEAEWSIESLKKSTEKKLTNLVLCTADIKQNSDGLELINYTNFKCYFDFSFNKFINALRDGHIQVDFRIGADLNGKAAFKYHDHGTGFRISSSKLEKLYDKWDII
ncbi:MvaI/BcnI family restriction endonuclease [Taylorella equigenitalis]|uniref:MvaI/BcnI restriction endonuclease domain-containing protein n=1 Tax=Taylorella equigenitalis (strain MCE9) TaxID=937774 RepID=A0A654KI23_TAYEM|nr:MvaI/BcnI family restriction endonuclease [Taylorella equigenitalis]ADU91536.1 conserved hypothetical protein [Taylorella equigenitalis MCE9]WDU56332.1 MvaI/BcnI restriction endonuclease family protein [Taylorella equigenitalis]